MSENLNGLSEHVAAGVSMIVHHHVKSSRCPALLVLEISRGSGWKRCVAIRVDLYEVCFPLTNCYFPCLRSNGCGEITLQLKTTAIYIIYNSKTANVIIYTHLIFYPRCCCAVIRTMQKSAGYKIYVPSSQIYMYLMSTSLSQNTDFSKNRLTLLTRHVVW